MSKFTIVQGHPDPSDERFNRALASRYVDAALAAGHEVRYVDVARMDFPIMRSADDFYNGEPPEAIRAAQGDVAWADHIVFFYPLWIGDVPALFKGFLEQTFRPGFAIEYGGWGLPKGLLHGKSARIVVTMGMPPFVYRALGAHTLKSLAFNMRMAGVKPVRETLIGGIGYGACEKTRAKWWRRMAVLAELDGKPRRAKAPANVPARVVGTVAALAAFAYLASVAVRWARFGGNAIRGDSLLDGVMPGYDVRLDHQVKIQAPVVVAFDAMCDMDFEHSPIVQALFRAREVLLRSRHDGEAMPHGLLKQLDALGWRIVAEESGRELVFGAVTQPWRANPVFRGLPPDQFARFNEPGYAKIAFTLRVDPVDSNTCIARTETRVQTTDAASRARFRRYWAFLAPGIELIRIVLLAQLKSEAEGRNNLSASIATPVSFTGVVK